MMDKAGDKYIRKTNSSNEDKQLVDIENLANQTNVLLSCLQSLIEENNISLCRQYSSHSTQEKFLLNEKISEYLKILLTSDLSLIKKVDVEKILSLYDSEKSITNKIKKLLSFHNQLSNKFKNEIKFRYKNITIGDQSSEN